MQNNETKSESAGRFSFYKAPITNKYPSEEITLEEAINRVKSDRYKAVVEKIRSEPNDDKRGELKKWFLDYITASGIFRERVGEAIIEPSGLAAIDIDDVDAPEEQAKIEQILKTDPYIKAYFRSPSNYFKAFIHVPKNANGEHKQYIKGFYDYLEKDRGINGEYLDKATHDINRACFLSYDPEAVIKTEAKIWDTKAEAPEYTTPPNKATLEDVGRVYGEVMDTGESFAHTFLLEYCLKNKLPVGERNNVPNKNFAAAVRNRPDREELIKAYCTTQELEPAAVWSWLKSPKMLTVNKIEISKYINRNNIPFEIPEVENTKELTKAVDLKLSLKQTTQAADLMAQYFIKNNRIFTTRAEQLKSTKSEVWIYNDGVYMPYGRTYIAEFVKDILEDSFTSSLAEAVFLKIEVDTYITQEEFFINDNIEEICVLNGVLNVITKELTPFTPDKVFFNKLPIYYDPDAKCDLIDKHFNEILEYPETDKAVLYEIFGFCLYREYFIEKAIMLNGTGRNGKGKTVGLLKKFLGTANITNLPLTVLEKKGFEVYNLFNRMANISPDLSGDALRDTSLFKQATGRDSLTAERKFLKPIDFINYAKFVFCTNDLPRTYDNTPAFWNRWVLLDFPYEFIPKDRYEKLNVPEKEKDGRKYKELNRKKYKIENNDQLNLISTPDQLSGLLNKAIEYLSGLLERGDFSYTRSVDEVKNTWRRKADSFLAFFEDCCVYDVGAEIKKDDLREAYAGYCKKHNLKVQSDKAIKYTFDQEGITDQQKYDWKQEGDNRFRVFYRAWINVRFKDGTLLEMVGINATEKAEA